MRAYGHFPFGLANPKKETMSVSIVSHVIAGCEVTGKLHHDVEVRGCVHPAATSSFCPQCGSPMYRTIRQEIPGYDGDNHLVIDGKRWNVVSDARTRRFVGIVLAEVCDWKAEVMRGEQLDDAAFRELRDALTSVKLWDPDTYAIWNILNVSR